MRDIAYGKGIFVAVGENEKISLTRDGVSGGPSTNLELVFGIDFSEGRFVAVGWGYITQQMG